MVQIWIAVIALVFASASPASAILLFDNASREDFTTTRDAEDSPLAAITVSAPTTIDQIGARMDLAAAGNLKFVIFNLRRTIGSLLWVRHDHAAALR